MRNFFLFKMNKFAKITKFKSHTEFRVSKCAGFSITRGVFTFLLCVVFCTFPDTYNIQIG